MSQRPGNALVTPPRQHRALSSTAPAMGAPASLEKYFPATSPSDNLGEYPSKLPAEAYAPPDVLAPHEPLGQALPSQSANWPMPMNTGFNAPSGPFGPSPFDSGMNMPGNL